MLNCSPVWLTRKTIHSLPILSIGNIVIWLTGLGSKVFFFHFFPYIILFPLILSLMFSPLMHCKSVVPKSWVMIHKGVLSLCLGSWMVPLPVCAFPLLGRDIDLLAAKNASTYFSSKYIIKSIIVNKHQQTLIKRNIILLLSLLKLKCKMYQRHWILLFL